MRYHKGDKIYKYELRSYIGGGSFGEVWLAWDHALNSECAVKLLLQNDVSIDEGLLEAQIGSRLQHDNVANIKYADVIQVEEINGSPAWIVIIVMPFYSKGSVMSQLNSRNFLDVRMAVKCFIDVLRGLEYLHEQGYYHCDIKPNNILVGDHGEYILSDYGITCYSPTHTAVRPRQCYMPHISPETLSNNIYDARTDIYQFGLTAFRLLNGVSEIHCDFIANADKFQEDVLQGKIITDRKYQPYIPRKLRRVISKAISINPDERYQTALEMRRALEQITMNGSCTADVKGTVVFHNHGYTYRYEILPKTRNTSDFIVYKKNDNSERETRATKYCHYNIMNSKINQMILTLSTDML